MEDEQKAVLIALLAGVFAGISSKYTGNLLGLAVGLVIVFALNYLQKTMFKEKKQGWSAGNVTMPYIFTWITTWIFLVNM